MEPDPHTHGPTRRSVIAGAVAAGAALGLPAPAHAEPDAPKKKPMPMRPLGKTGAKVSLFGLGCYPIGAMAKEDDGVAVVLRAIDAGCTYIDTAPSYSRGTSERRVGLALKARKDKDILLATKTHTRTESDARRDLEQSLDRLQVERIDLLQVHAVSTLEDMQRALDKKRGPLAALLKAKEEGLIRWIGVTGHADPYVMRRTFEKYPFASILFPLNCVDPHYTTRGKKPERLSFVEQTLPAAIENGLGRIAMKVFASGRLAKKGIDPELCLRYTYGLDISTCIVGCNSIAQVDLAARVAREQKPLTEAETKALLASTKPHRGKGTEWYKR